MKPRKRESFFFLLSSGIAVMVGSMDDNSVAVILIVILFAIEITYKNVSAWLHELLHYTEWRINNS